MLPAEILMEWRQAEWPPGQAQGDPNLFADVVFNLLFNARDAATAGGHISIEVHEVVHNGAAAGRRKGRPLPSGNYVIVAVEDDGVGMTEAVRRHAREPFFTTKGMANARGLGLAVADGFARGSGGALRIRSAPGEGTRVELWLPALSQPQGDA